MSGDGSSSRQPPRFVPTLTAVVDLQREAAELAPAPAPVSAPAPVLPDLRALPSLELGAEAALAPSSLLRQASAPWSAADASAPFARAASPSAGTLAPPMMPPSMPASLPVLDTVFEHDAQRADPPSGPAVEAAAPSFKALPVRDDADAFRLEEELLHRVLQRVDLSLEERLTDAVSSAVQQQLDAMIPKLREEVEAVLRQLVVEAMSHELSETPGKPGV